MQLTVWMVIAALASVAPLASAVAQDATPRDCYQLRVGPWSPPLDDDSVYYRIPSVVQVVGDRDAASAGPLEPNLRYPDPDRSFPGLPAWTREASVFRLMWSNGFAATIVTLRVQGDSLVGTATAEADVITVPPTAPPSAPVSARRVACPVRARSRPAP